MICSAVGVLLDAGYGFELGCFTYGSWLVARRFNLLVSCVPFIRSALAPRSGYRGLTCATCLRTRKLSIVSYSFVCSTSLFAALENRRAQPPDATTGSRESLTPALPRMAVGGERAARKSQAGVLFCHGTQQATTRIARSTSCEQVSSPKLACASQRG